MRKLFLGIFLIFISIYAFAYDIKTITFNNKTDLNLYAYPVTGEGVMVIPAKSQKTFDFPFCFKNHCDGEVSTSIQIVGGGYWQEGADQKSIYSYDKNSADKVLKLLLCYDVVKMMESSSYKRSTGKFRTDPTLNLPTVSRRSKGCSPIGVDYNLDEITALTVSDSSE